MEGGITRHNIEMGPLMWMEQVRDEEERLQKITSAFLQGNTAWREVCRGVVIF